jgi:hypothetical protein
MSNGDIIDRSLVKFSNPTNSFSKKLPLLKITKPISNLNSHKKKLQSSLQDLHAKSVNLSAEFSRVKNKNELVKFIQSISLEDISLIDEDSNDKTLVIKLKDNDLSLDRFEVNTINDDLNLFQYGDNRNEYEQIIQSDKDVTSLAQKHLFKLVDGLARYKLDQLVQTNNDNKEVSYQRSTQFEEDSVGLEDVYQLDHSKTLPEIAPSLRRIEFNASDFEMNDNSAIFFLRSLKQNYKIHIEKGSYIIENTKTGSKRPCPNLLLQKLAEMISDMLTIADEH